MTLGVFRTSAGSLGGSSTPQAAITVPGTVLATDYCLLLCMAGGGTNAGAAPDGTWSTVKADATINAAAARYAIYGKVIGSATTITPSWPTAPASGNNTAHLALFFSGVSGAEAVGSPSSPSGTASAATTCPAITTLGVDREVLALAFNKGGSTGFPSSITWAGGFTGIANQFASANFYPGISVAKLDKPTAGATTDQTGTWNFATLSQVGLQLALIPSALALSASLSISPNAGAAPLAATATVTASGGDGNPFTYSMTWGDGSSSAAQSSNTFTHTYAAAGEYDPVATVSQA